MNFKALFSALVLLSLFTFSFAGTTCETKDCKITIKLKIAFAGANDTYIRNAENEIESVWNAGQWTFGDCNCPVSFDVETKKITDPNQANCNPGPPGYHCIMVTDYNNNPPRNQTNMTGAQFYIGYMYGIATGNGGNSQRGWWSNIMSRPVQGGAAGEHYLDFAHEAGHMMGLEDGDGGLMNTTSGDDAKPTQDHINEIVNEICGANACPGRCCCGNGNIDEDKGEECDPFAEEDKCGDGEYCCPVCCSCWGKICFPEWGEYENQEACQASCGTNAKCYYNYQTGCWDCVEHVVVEEVPYNPDDTRQIGPDDHSRQEDVRKIEGLYREGLLSYPYLGGFLANEMANVMIERGNNYHAVTVDGELAEVGGGLLEGPTVEITTDTETLQGIESGMIDPLAAYQNNMIKIEGVGFLEGIKFWFGEFLVDVLVPYEEIMSGDVAVTESPAEEPEDGIDGIKPAIPAIGGDFPEEGVTEDILKID